MQEVITDMVAGIEQLVKVENMEAWLTTCVQNRAISRLRARKTKRRAVELTFTHDLWSTMSSGPKQIGEQVTAEVSAVLELMPADQRALLLEHSDGEDERIALAAKFGISISTLRRRLIEDRDVFRDLWENRGNAE